VGALGGNPQFYPEMQIEKGKVKRRVKGKGQEEE